MGRSPKPSSADLKTAILSAARARFANEGYEATSMRHIAEEAGCSATAIYIYFSSKEALMDALVLEDFKSLATAFQKLGRERDPIQRLRKMVHAFMVFGVQYPNHYRLIFMTRKPDLHSPVDDRGRDTPSVNPYLGLLKTLEEATLKKRFREELKDVDLIAQTIFTAIHGVLALHTVQFRDRWILWRPLKARVDFMLDALIEGLKA